MKSYTDLEQSKKLAEILPLESADMCFNISQRYNMPPLMTPYSKFNEFFNMEKTPDFLIPCWSLAALLGVLPFHLIVNNQRYAFDMIKGLDKNGETYAIKYAVFNTTFYFHLTQFYNNPVDACVEMIEKLHELKML